MDFLLRLFFVVQVNIEMYTIQFTKEERDETIFRSPAQIALGK